MLALFTRFLMWTIVTTEDSLVPRNEYGIIIGAEPVHTEGCSQAVLLLHGLGSSPSDFWQFYPYLDRKDLTINSPLIAGHGTSPKDLRKTSYESWILSAETAYASLKDSGKDVVVVGNSMGSLLALELASKHEIDHVILINPPLELQTKLVNFLPIFGLFESYHPKNIFTVNDEGYPDYAITYKAYPLNSISELITLKNRVNSNLGKVDEPVLVFQSGLDTLVDHGGGNNIVENSKSEDVELVSLTNSTHTYFTEEDLELIYEKIDPLLNC